MKKTNIATTATLFCILLFESLFASDDTVDIHGFISQGYLKTTRNNFIEDSKNGTFQYNEMGINFGKEPIKNLYIGIQFFARDLGDKENDEIQIDYAYADYQVTDLFGIRAGRVKNTIGIYSDYRDMDMLRTCIILPPSVYDENLRDSQNYLQGVSVYGNIIMENLGTISYQALIGSNDISPDRTTATFLGGNLVKATTIDLDTMYSYALHYIAPKRLFQISGTAFFTSEIKFDGVTRPHSILDKTGIGPGTPVDSVLSDIEVYTASFTFTANKLIFSYEQKYLKVKKMVRKILLPPKAEYISHLDRLGFYYMITYSLNDYINIGTYYDVYYRDRKDRNGRNPILGMKDYQYWMKDWAISCKIYINSYWQFKLETHYIDGVGSLMDEYNDEGLHKYWWMHAAKISYNF